MQRLRSRLSRNTLALLLSNGGSAALSFALSVMIGRALGQGGLGVYVVALSWIFPLSLIAEFGLGTLITRNVAQDLTQAHAYLAASVRARVMLGGGLMLAIWLMAPMMSANPQVVAGLRLSAPMVVILPFYSSFTAIFRAHEVMQPIAALNLGMLLTQVSGTALALWLHRPLETIFIINTGTSALQLVAAWWVYRWYFYRPSASHITLAGMMQKATPFAIAAVLAATQARIVIILLEQFATTEVVGLYAAAARFIEAGRLLPHAFFDALFPLLAGLASQPKQLERTFRRVLLGLIAFGVLFGVSLSLIAKPLLTLSYGTTFAAASPILILLAWSLLPMLLKSGRTLYWYAQGREMYVNTVTLGVIIIQVMVAWWLIPRYGAIGAAGVMLLAETSAALLLFMRQH